MHDHERVSHGWWKRKQFEEREDEFRIPISKANLVPWHWGGIRGEVVTLAVITAIILLGIVHTFYAGLIVPFLIICVGKALHTWHPYWLEILVRLICQPEGFQDS